MSLILTQEIYNNINHDLQTIVSTLSGLYNIKQSDIINTFKSFEIITNYSNFNISKFEKNYVKDVNEIKKFELLDKLNKKIKKLDYDILLGLYEDLDGIIEKLIDDKNKKDVKVKDENVDIRTIINNESVNKENENNENISNSKQTIQNNRLKISNISTFLKHWKWGMLIDYNIFCNNINKNNNLDLSIDELKLILFDKKIINSLDRKLLKWDEYNLLKKEFEIL